MEVWQKNHIIKNLPALLETTRCNTTLLTSLRSKQILSREDVEVVEATTGGNTSRTKVLYDLLQTKINGYGILKECLEETQQSGALDILNQISSKSLLKYYGSISYDKNKLIGRGCWGTKVFRGTHSVRDVAVKIIDCEDVDVDKALHEVNLLKDLQWHENIVQFYHAEVTEDSVFIALELCSTSLNECIRHKMYPISRVDILRQATSGLLYLHSNSIVHRDLKPSNILLMKTKDSAVVKLSDFGMSKRLYEDRSSYTYSNFTGFGTQGWMAPEVINYVSGVSEETAGRLSFSTDVFPLGCIFYFTLTDGIHPFGIAVRCDGNILDGDPTLDASELMETGEDCLILIEAMLHSDPRQRPTCSEILSSRLFHSLQAGISTNLANNTAEVTIGFVGKSQKNIQNISSKKLQKILLETKSKYHAEMQSQLPNPKIALDRQIMNSLHIGVSDMAIQDLDESLRQNEVIQHALNNSFRKYSERNEMNLNSENDVAIGIDFGTTHCSAAFYRKGEVHAVRSPKGENVLTAAISLHNMEQPKFGNDARWAAVDGIQYTVFDLKRMIGQSVADLKLQKQFWEWYFVPKDSPNGLLIEGKDQDYGIPELISMLLGELRSWAITIVGKEVNKAVITVPSNFTESQREIVKLSGELAGLKILEILNEPVAIATAYDFQFHNVVENGKKILIFDFGGGTFQASIVEIKEGKIRVLAEEHEPNLGGNDIDNCMLDHCVQNIKDTFGLDLVERKDSNVTAIRERSRLKLREIQLHCESTKILLSSKTSAIVECGSFDVQGIFHTKIFLTSLFQNRYPTVNITRDKLNELCDPLFQKILKILDKLLETSGVTKRDLDEIILVGGSTKIPRVRELLQNYFPGKVLKQDINPDEVVAHGAAIRAALLNKYD